MSGLKPYTAEQTYTTPASLEAMAKKLDEIDHHARQAVAASREARDFAKQSSDFAGRLVQYQSLPNYVKIAAIVGGAALGGGGVTWAWHFLHSLIA
jgi:hypothetical protein